MPDSGASVASSCRPKATPFFSTLDSAPRALQGLAGHACLPEPSTLSAPILSKRRVLSELKSFRNVFIFSVQGGEQDGGSVRGRRGL